MGQRAWFFALGLGLLGGCATMDYAHRTPEDTQDGAPASAPYDLRNLPDPVPVQEPPSRYGNPPTYEVFGKTYRTLDSAVGYRAEGFASWYGRKFHGRRTSSGEPFDMFKLTAAHRSLPIPTYVRVTNLENGRQTLVRVNDRGPFHADRILDLSYAAAVKLGFAEQGTARISLEAVGAGDAPSAGESYVQAGDAPPAEELYLQAGAFRDLMAARNMQRSLRSLTGERTVVIRRPEDTLYRVRIGPLADEGSAQRLQSIVVAAKFAKPILLRLGGG